MQEAAAEFNQRENNDGFDPKTQSLRMPENPMAQARGSFDMNNGSEQPVNSIHDYDN